MPPSYLQKILSNHAGIMILRADPDRLGAKALRPAKKTAIGTSPRLSPGGLPFQHHGEASVGEREPREIAEPLGHARRVRNPWEQTNLLFRRPDPVAPTLDLSGGIRQYTSPQGRNRESQGSAGWRLITYAPMTGRTIDCSP